MKRAVKTPQKERDKNELFSEGLCYFFPDETSNNHVDPPPSPRFFHLHSLPKPNEARANHPNHLPILSKQRSGSTTSTESNTTQTSSNSPSTALSEHTTEAKRMRNRESARLTREKKKKKMAHLENENDRLKQEVERLKQENFILIHDNTQLAQTVSQLSAGYSR